jgi:hypothetical protein
VNAAPEPELLTNGDILVPTRRSDGSREMVRLSPDDSEYDYWLREVQARRGQPGGRGSAGAPIGGIIVGFLLPPVGVVWAIVLFAQGRAAHGGAVLLASIFGWVVGAVLFL